MNIWHLKRHLDQNAAGTIEEKRETNFQQLDDRKFQRRQNKINSHTVSSRVSEWREQTDSMWAEGEGRGDNHNDEEDETVEAARKGDLEPVVPSVVERSVKGRKVRFFGWIKVEIRRVERPVDRRNVRSGHCTFFKCFPMETVKPSIRFDLSNSSSDVAQSFTKEYGEFGLNESEWNKKYHKVTWLR